MGLHRSACSVLTTMLLAASAQAATRKIVVLPLDITHAKKGVDADAREKLEGTLREEAASALSEHGWKILTGAATATAIADADTPCKQESCQLALAKEIKVEKFIGGTVQAADGQLTLSVRLVDTASGTVLSSEKVTAKTVARLQQGFEAKAAAFFERANLNRMEPEEAPPAKAQRRRPPVAESEDAPVVHPAPAAIPPPPVAAAPVAMTAPPPELRSGGFLLGLELGGASWSADPSKIVLQDDTTGTSASAFTAPLNASLRPALNLHLGWNFMGYAAAEAAIHASFWDALNSQRGGAGMVGGRATYFPLQHFKSLRNRSYDAGLEFGGGYSIAGGPTFGMEGHYLAFGVVGEYYLKPFVSLSLFWRYVAQTWGTFYYDFNNNLKESLASAFSAGVNTFGIGVNLHVGG